MVPIDAVLGMIVTPELFGPTWHPVVTVAEQTGKPLPPPSPLGGMYCADASMQAAKNRISFLMRLVPARPGQLVAIGDVDKHSVQLENRRRVVLSRARWDELSAAGRDVGTARCGRG